MGTLTGAILDLDKEGALAAVQRALRDNRDPLEIVDEARAGMEEVGRRYENGDYFLMELMRAAQVFRAAAAALSPAIKERYGSTEAKGTVLLGTVKGDVHDLGKNIVANLLDCKGYEVIDLGVDVPAAAFVEKVKEARPAVVGLSALLTACVHEMSNTIHGMEAAGIRSQVKVIVGGGIVGDVDPGEIGADHAAANANEGIKVIERWFEAGAGGEW